MRSLSHLQSITLLLIFSIALYTNTLKNGFVYDDELTIINNTLIKDIHRLPMLFEKRYIDFSGETSYRPVVTFTYFLDYAVYGLNPWGYHLTNIFLHALNGLLLYVFLVLLIKPSPSGRQKSGISGFSANLPLLITLLFICHPVLTETVNAVSFREDLLSFLFYIAALILYMLAARKPQFDTRAAAIYALSITSYFLALLSKEMALTLPIIVYCYKWLYADKKKGPPFPRLFNGFVIGYLAVTIIYVYLISFYYFKNIIKGPAFPDWTLSERLLTLPWLLSSYIKLLFFPFSLSADYVIDPVESLFSLSFIAPFAVLASLLAAAFMIKGKEKGLSFGILFFIITLIPVYNLVPIANPLAERYLYLPSLGFFFFIVQAACFLKFPELKLSQNLSVTLLLVIIAVMYPLTVFKRNTVWKSDLSLWSDTVREMPNNSRAHLGLGIAYTREKRLEEAKVQYRAALDINPLYASPLVERQYRITLKMKPDYIDAHKELGILYAGQGKFEKAVSEFQAILRQDPLDFISYNNLGLAYANLGRFDEAAQAFQAALNVKADYLGASYNLGVAYLKRGQNDKALEQFEIILKQQPNNVQASRVIELLRRDKN